MNRCSIACALTCLSVWMMIAPSFSRDAELDPQQLDSKATVERRPLLDEQAYREQSELLRVLYSKPPEQWPPATVDRSVQAQELGLVGDPPIPDDNPQSPQKIELGRMLFFDPRLSGSGEMACASCHDPDLGWADGRTTAFGRRRVTLERNTPSVLFSGHWTALFHDGRAASLEDQALQVLHNPREMNADLPRVIAQLAQTPQYAQRFGEVFGPGPITPHMIAQALASFERSIKGGQSRFDAFLRGKSQALSDAAIRGLHLFRTAGRCMNCHHGPLLTDQKFHDLGLSFYGRKLEDLGRYRVTGQASDVGAFRTPTLRNVTATAPHMHNGLFDLRGVLVLYRAGMPTLRRKPAQLEDPLFPTKSPLLQPLPLNDHDLDDLTAFLESLREPRRRVRAPELPGLHPPELEQSQPGL